MKVRALKTFADERLHPVGEEYEEADDVAKVRIKKGLVEAVDEKPEKGKKKA